MLHVCLAGSGSTFVLHNDMTHMLLHAGSSGGTGVALAARFAAGGSCTGAAPSLAGFSAGMHTQELSRLLFEGSCVAPDGQRCEYGACL